LLDIIILLIILLLFNLFFKFKVVFYTIHRLSIAAIHYNENCERQELVTENGDLCYNISYPKAKKGTEAVVKPRKGPPTCGIFFHFLEDTSQKKNHKICLSMYMYMSRYNILTLCPLHSLSSIRDVFMQTGTKHNCNVFL
jgi:hypothetical protein